MRLAFMVAVSFGLGVTTGANADEVALDPVTGLRSITGDVIGTLYLP